MKKLIVVDMQNDFIDGALGTEEAVSIVDKVREKISVYDIKDVYYTLDTHGEEYLKTQEGTKLPVKHCVKGTPGWELSPELSDILSEAKCFEKPTFGSVELAEELKETAAKSSDLTSDGRGLTVELIGLCTDICVVSNAMLIKAFLPEAIVKVDPSCCAGVTPEGHEAALKTMASCQIEVE